MKDLIIHAGDSRPRYLRVLEAVVTLAIWAGYLYLLRGVFLFVWAYVQQALYGVTPTLQDGAAAVTTSLNSYGEVIVFDAEIFIGWAIYNQLMFGRRNRRRAPAPVTTEEIGAFFHLTAEQVDECRLARRLTLRHDLDGGITGYDTGTSSGGPTSSGE